MAKRGKKYQEALKLVDRLNKYSLDEAVELVKKTSYAKFDATIELYQLGSESYLVCQL